MRPNPTHPPPNLISEHTSHRIIVLSPYGRFGVCVLGTPPWRVLQLRLSGAVTKLTQEGTNSNRGEKGSFPGDRGQEGTVGGI